MSAYTFFEIRVPKTSDTTPEAMIACLKALPRVKNTFWDRFTRKSEAISLEMVTWNQRIYFMAAIPTPISSYFSSQIIAQYPSASIATVGDYMPYLMPLDDHGKPQIDEFATSKLVLEKPYFLPLKTYEDYKDVDPLSTTLGTLAKSNPKDKIVLQYLINSAPSSWQAYGMRIANSTIPTSDPEKTMPHPQKALIESKVSQTGFIVGINLLVISETKLQAEAIISNIAGSYSTLTHGEGNSLNTKGAYFWQRSKYLKSILNRQPLYTPKNQVLTAQELATMYHLPNQLLKDIRNIAWGGTLKGEPPENLPIATSMTEEEKQNVNFFARTEFKSNQSVFGIKTLDRRKHIYIIGKTGVGKSTLIANMAINDMRNGNGLGIIDPHGDLVETVLDYIPSYRLNDVVYLNPNNQDAPFRMNPLEVHDQAQAELVASGIVAIFHKLFAYSWGPRLEYILRNTLLTLTSIPDTTLLDIPKILTNTGYRKRCVEKLQDPVLISFWENEFARLDQRQQTEAVSPILNKVGQFITSPKIRTILERPHSSVNLQEIMDNKKILLLNLSQGLIGEDNAALLGAMFITKIQLAAMNRVMIPESQRQDFYLYVDEFQNFATSSFVKILSEARKYRLNLTVANQYMAQVQEDLQKAIFGNIGTLISFLVGSSDANHLNQEFGGIYEESDLVNLDNYEVITKLSIDNRTSSPFPAKTLPLPYSKNENRQKAIMLSNERYGKPDKKKDGPDGNQSLPHPQEVKPQENSPQPTPPVPPPPPPLASTQPVPEPPFHHNDASAHELINPNQPKPDDIIPVTPLYQAKPGGSAAHTEHNIQPQVTQAPPSHFSEKRQQAENAINQLKQQNSSSISQNNNDNKHRYNNKNRRNRSKNRHNRPQSHRPIMVVEEQ